MKVCIKCKNTFSRPIRVGLKLWNKRKWCSRSCYLSDHSNENKKFKCAWLNKKRLNYMDDKNSAYKGIYAGYRAIHYWIEQRLGQPNKCEFCKIDKKKKYHWANISGEYKRDITDFIRLCVSCHKKFDMKRRSYV